MKIIIIYCYFEIFGGWILKLLHIPASLGLGLMQILDILPFLYFIFKFHLKRNNSGLPNSASFWNCAILLLILSIFTTIVQNGKISSSLIHFGIIFRFAALAAIISSIKTGENSTNKLFKHYSIISGILVVIGYIEIIGSASVLPYFIPLSSNVSSAQSSLKDIGAGIFGIFPNTVDYSYFLLLSYIIISNKKGIRHQFILFLIYLVPLYYSGSKAALLILILCLSFKLESVKLIRNTFILMVICASSLLIYNFWDLFYWTVFIDSQASRLGYIIFTLPYFLSELSFGTFFGMSPTKEIVHEKINSYPYAPSLTWNLEDMGSFEDEFYVALPVYYGIIGFAIIVYLFFRMLKTYLHYHWRDNTFNYSTIIKSISATLIIAPLFNQIIIIKPFSLFMWIFLGLFIHKGNYHRESNKCQVSC